MLCIGLAQAQETPVRASNATSAEHRVALVIGNAAYGQGSLANPVNDARAMASRLRTLGFDVILRENLKTRDIGGVYREFRSKIAPGNVALVFYAGHGIQFKGQNYFPAVDSVINSEEDVPLQSLNLSSLLDNMEEAKAGVSLVFLDACRNNPYSRSFRSPSNGLAKVEAASGTLIHYATKPGSVAADGDGKNGTYTEALLAQMSEPGVPVELMLKRVANRVVTKTKGKQEPWVEGSLRGDFYFFGPTTVQVQGGATDDSESQTWAAAQQANSNSAYQAYLDAFPQGRYVVAAKIAMESLRQPGAQPSKLSKPTPGKPEDAETAFWNEVKSSGAREYLDAYVKQYPKGKYLALARIELKKIDDQQQQERNRQAAQRQQEEQTAWDNAKTTDTEPGYAAYTDSYPRGRYVTLAQAAQQRLRREAVERDRQEAEQRQREQAYTSLRAEEQSWRKAQMATDSATVQAYLDSYPAGRFLAQARAHLLAVKKAEADLKPGKVFNDCDVCPEMVVLPSGNFIMGGNDNSDERPPHTVSIRSFAIGRTEVTQGEWRAMMGSNPSTSFSCGNTCPVESVSWDDAQLFVQKLNASTGKIYRLPSEAEWEFAARAGSTGEWSFGNDESLLGQHAWYTDNSGSKTHPVAGKQPNAFGLFDVHGNVGEWTQDCWNLNYFGAPSDGSAWTSGNCGQRVIRGGSLVSGARSARVADRERRDTSYRYLFYGFRIARTL
jgi:formylglycine-generating enzyme required for sulfatase activity